MKKKINNNLSQPLNDSVELNIINEDEDVIKKDQTDNKNIPKKKVAFFSRLFFLWTLMIMKISNKKKLKKEIIRESPLYTDQIEQDKFNQDFIFIKELWEGKKNKNGFKTWKICPMIFTIIRFNLLKLLYLLFLLFIVQVCKMVILIFKRRIINLFYDREQNLISNYTKGSFRLSLTKNIACFLLIELVRFLVNHQLKFGQRKLTRRTTSLINLLIYEKFMIQKLLQSNMKEGDLINYLQTDTESLASFFLQITKILIFPFQFFTYFIILYRIFGKAFYVGLSTFILLMIFSIITEDIYIKNQYRYLKEKDRRINFTSQTIKNIKELKLLQWEDTFQKVIGEKRAKEMIFMKTKLNISVVLIIIHWIMPLLMCLTTIGAYVKINDKFLNIADLMTFLEIIDNLRGPIIYLPDRVRELINAYVSLNRLAAFLKISTEKKSNITKKKDEKYSINISEAKIGTNKDNILITINNLTIEKGESCVIIGETGSGKSCLMKSLIDRLIILSKKEFNINGTISYASQTPFIINATVRDNILFYSKYNEERYNQVIKYCQLEKDIDSLPAGDLTEIGTNGANLSGGQKSRINLARSVYQNADIYLFDDPISSVDSIVYNKILEFVLKNFLRNKTVIFAMNDIKYMHHFTKVIFIEKEQVKFFGKQQELEKEDFFQSFKLNQISNKSKQNKKDTFLDNSDSVDKTEKTDFKTEEMEDSDKQLTHIIKSQTIINQLIEVEKEKIISKGKLMVEEEMTSGKIGSRVYKAIIEYSGGYIQIILVFIFAIIWQFTIIEGNVYLANWSEKIDVNNDDENLYHFMIYTLYGIVCIFSLFLKEFLISKMNYNLSKNFHDVMLQNVIEAPINLYHDITPFGQIMNKFTIDLDKCVLFFRHLSATLKYICTLIGSIIVCINSNLYVLFFLPVIFYCGFKISVYYAPAGRDILRIESIDRAPLLSFYSESIQGIDTIKSLKYYNVDKLFFKKFEKKLLGHFSIFMYKFGTRTFFELSLDLLSVIFVFFLFIYCIIFHEQFNAIMISLLLKYSLSISEDILIMLTHGTELENSFVRVERCENATHLPKENYGKDLNEVPNKNDFDGNIKMDHVFIKYRDNLDFILRDISLNISFGEKICVVGRTGSGKSTIILALFRLIETNKGKILINGKNIKDIPLKTLRRNLGIVPQEPKIFSGTLKFNLDPKKKYSDFEINNAIREVGLFKLMKENGRDIRKKLNMRLKEDGGNLSLGEKQLICLARIFLRKNKIVVMDEATSNIDNKTDNLIQNAVDKIFKNSTLITIAHKLPDLNKYNRIMVLDSGHLVEFDTPDNLLKNKKGVFKQLYENNIVS